MILKTLKEHKILTAFCIGLPSLLLGLFLLYGFIKDIIKASSRGSMKEKKNVKDNCFVLTINLFVCLVGFLFTAFGVS